MGLFYQNEKESPEDLKPIPSTSADQILRTESRPIIPANKVEALSQTSILGEAITQTVAPKTKTVKAQFDCEDIDIDDVRCHRAREGVRKRVRPRVELARSPPPNHHRTHTSRPKQSRGHTRKGMEPVSNPETETAQLSSEDIRIDDRRHQRAREHGRKRRRSTHRRRTTRAHRSHLSPVPRKRTRIASASLRRPRTRPAGLRIKSDEDVKQASSDVGSDVGSVSSYSSGSEYVNDE